MTATGTRPEAPGAVQTEPASFDELYAAHYGTLTVQLYAYFGDRQEAQDIVQEAFCRALARWRTVSRYDDPVAWVRRVAWNLALSRWRRARTALAFLSRQRRTEAEVPGPSPERVAVLAALAELPPPQRRAVVLRYLADLRTEALAEVLPPGAGQARRTVRRRRGIAASAGAVLAVTVILSGIALAGGRSPHDPAPLPPSGGPSTMAPPRPDPQQSARMDAAEKALGDPEKQPWVMATTGVVTADYAGHINDMPADDYLLFVHCAGPGTVDVVVKAGNYGDKKLAAGTVACSEQPVPGRLALTQPVHGYLRIFLYGDEQAAGRAQFSFKFVRTAEIDAPPSAASTANAATAAALLGGAGVEKVTTESDKTLDEPRPAGDYLAGFACAGPGTVSFIIRSAKTLRDGTVATDGRTQVAVSHECTAAGKVTRNVAMSLPAGSAFTITAEANDAARNRAGWAYAFTPA